ncbi:hypothetical protein Scep_030917 [Stephania cephalantha]|uniref:Uncharacterized protein n=1 Tax=Stephania cephalantha TaxID=152367 RepID=A0AAP0E0Q0_9MAGN
MDERKGGEAAASTTVPFYKLFFFADSKDVILMVLGTIFAMANGMAMPLMTVLIGNVVDSFGQNASGDQVVHEVSKVALRFVYLAVGACIASFFRKFRKLEILASLLKVSCWIVTGERQAARIRFFYLKTILRQDIAFFDKETNAGEVIERISGDTALIQDAMGEKVGKFIQLVSTFIGGFVIAFIKGWLLTLVMLSSIPPLVMAGAAMAIAITKMASRGQTAYSEAGSIAEETISSIRTVASFTGEKEAIAKYNRSLAKAYKYGVQEGLASGLGLGSFMFVILCSWGLAIWYGGRLASPCLGAFAAGQAAAFKMLETINRKPDIDSYDTNGLVLDDINGDIEVRDIYFSYPARPEEQILCGFSLSVPSGTTTALVGPSGSGKSTVISLIERFYDPQDGEVLIDGVNLKAFQLRWIREKIGLVSQEPVLFATSIKDNIIYGKEGATLEEIKRACDLANATKFIDKLPQGLDTLVGQHGTQLSGGQKQRVAIARAVLKDPRILLLDEATSALDTESERVVQEALDRIMLKRTTVIVAHRLSTIRNAHVIAVLHQGKLVEKGSHSELIGYPDGAYYQLVHLQNLNKESEEHILDDRQKSEISIESGRQSSNRMSLRSLSRRSSGAGSSSRHSFSTSFRMPTGLNIQEIVLAEPSTESSSSKQTHQVSLRRLAYLNSKEIPVMLLGTIAAMVNGFIYPSFGILFAGLAKSLYEPPSQLRKDSRFWSLMFVTAGVVALVGIPARTYFFAIAGCKLIKRLRSMCFTKVVHMEVGWFDMPENSSGAISARLSADAAAIRGLVGDPLSVLVQNIATAVAGLAIGFQACWQLSIIILVMIPLLMLNGWIQIKFLKGFSADAKILYEEASQIASDAVSSIRTVASFCAEEKVMKLYEKKSEGPTRLVQDGKTTFSKVFRVFFALAVAALGISQSSSYVPDSGKAKASAASVFSIIDRKSEIDSSDESGITLENVKGDIEFRHVAFKYPSRPDVQILTDLSFSIHSGKTVALVGESGSGKSTVISLLQRFYDTESGHITLDGIEIQKFQLRWLRQQMGVVSQEPVLFSGTIRANIAYGKGGNATEAEIVAAAELANAHRFISALQQGYDTKVGERGTQLSGGQKQRIAIARAIVKGPKILLLDEATSALDAESERAVQDALDRVMVDRTTVMIAHRLSTIKNADLIAVVKNGMIVEKGKHDSLISIKDGAYASLAAYHMNNSS